MTASDLLLEIGCEEIPSRYMAEALEQLKSKAASLFEEQRLPYCSLESWGTPRRLVLFVSELTGCQENLREKLRGPSLDKAFDLQGRPTPALLGFARSQGVAPEEAVVEKFKGADYMVIYHLLSGKETVETLPALLTRLLNQLTFPRAMYWQSKELRFARPVRWLLALYGGETIPFSIGGLQAGRQTYGHRFLSAGPLIVGSPAEYFRRLEENFVILNQDCRRDIVRRQAEEAAAVQGGRLLLDEALLEEVNYLVEYPVAVTGSFSCDYLKLPRELLITTMQHHQRYFPVVDDGGALLPCFIGISNNLDHEKIRRGYEKVLQARLADARFFFEEDQKISLDSRVQELQRVIFQDSLGSLDEKRRRLQRLVRSLAARLKLPAEQAARAERVAHLCKADLVSLMVKEFAELQGVMGREYARLNGEPEEVALGIYEHYLPRFAGDELPAGIEGALVSLADRIDTLAGFLAIGIQPTGSQDPYGLRRQAQGVIAVLLDRGFELTLEELFEEAYQALKGQLNISLQEKQQLMDKLNDFLKSRIRFTFQEKGLSYDVIEAAIAVPFISVDELFQRASALEKQLRGKLIGDLITAYQRAANLSRQASGGKIDLAGFKSEAEIRLFRALQEAESRLEAGRNCRRYDACLNALRILCEPLNFFFDQVLVMADEPAIRENRLNLLLAVKKLFGRIADFSLLQSPE